MTYLVKFLKNQLTITDYNGFVLSVAGEKIVTDVTANDGLWHFICVCWESDSGLWNVYKDGALSDSGDGLATGKHIQGAMDFSPIFILLSFQGGGLVVIGQEQDEKGGKFRYMVNIFL